MSKNGGTYILTKALLVMYIITTNNWKIGILCLYLALLPVYTQAQGKVSAKVNLVFPSKHIITNVQFLGINQGMRAREFLYYAKDGKAIRRVPVSRIAQVRFLETPDSILLSKLRKPSLTYQRTVGWLGNACILTGVGFAYHSWNLHKEYKLYRNEYLLRYAEPNLSRNALHERSNQHLTTAIYLGITGLVFSGYHLYMKREYMLHRLFKSKARREEFKTNESSLFFNLKLYGFYNSLSLRF